MSVKVTTVLLDADGVVQKPVPGWLDRLGELCGAPDRHDEFLADVFAAEKPALTGQVEFRPALAAVLERWGCPVSLEEAIDVWQLIQPHEQILEVVAELRSRGCRVSLATNQQAERAAFMSDSLGYSTLFDDLFYSCEVGHAKPDPAYFAAVLDQLSQPGDTVLFVDDHPDNVVSARSAGLQGAVFDARTGGDDFRALLASFWLMKE